MKKLRIIVGGYIGLYPTGGVTWDYIQYPLGLKLMGHDVYYIEDTLQYSRFQSKGKPWQDVSDCVEYLNVTMEKFGFKDKWAYRDVASGNCFGLTLERIKELCKTADIFINISASTILREEYLKIPTRILIDSDPMFTQIEYFNECKVETIDQLKIKFILENHTHLFTFGENIGNDNCQIPVFNFNWIPTRQPICISYWLNKTQMNFPLKFTSVMNWSVRPDLIYDNKKWGQKNTEFENFIEIPAHFPESEFEVQITGITEEKKKEITKKGWKILNPLQTLMNADAYQLFISSSSAEFSVAKETYVKSNSGWFSCRSACYLAAGKPVVTQETGWSKYIPSGNGLFAFTDLSSAIEAIDAVRSNTLLHSKVAKEIAWEFFDSKTVLTKMLENLN